MKHVEFREPNRPARDGETLSDEQKRDASDAALRSMQREYADAVRQAYGASERDGETLSDEQVEQIYANAIDDRQGRSTAFIDKGDLRAICDTVAALRAELAKLRAERDSWQTFTMVPYPAISMLGGCDCWNKAPSVPTCRDSMQHLEDCPARGSGYPVGTYIAGRARSEESDTNG